MLGGHEVAHKSSEKCQGENLLRGGRATEQMWDHVDESEIEGK